MEKIDIDGVRFKVEADLSKLEADLKRGEKTSKDAGEKMGKAAGTGFGDVFGAIAGAAMLNGVKGFFSSAASEFNKLEMAMNRVASTSKAFGQNIEANKKSVQELADKGFLSLTESANAFSDSVSLGLDPTKAKKFVEALSDIAAVERTMGTLNEAVSSGIGGLRSGSAERVENIGISVKKLSQEYQINTQKIGAQAAIEKFYQGVQKESLKYQGEALKTVETLAGAQVKYNNAVDKASAAIGKGLEPTLKSLYSIGQNIAEAFAKWFDGLDSKTKTLVLMAPAIGAVTMAIGSAIPVLKALSMSNPFGWVALAITGLIALTAALNEVATVNVTKIVKSYKDTALALKEQGDRAKELEAINKRTASQEKELIDIKEKLRARAKALGVDYDQLAKSAGSAAAATAILTSKEREREANKLRVELKSVMDDREALERRVKIVSDTFGNTNGLEIGLAMRGMSVEGIRGLQAKRQAELVQGIADIYQPDATGNAPAVAALANSGAKEARFLESAEKLKEIEKNLVFTIGKAKGDKTIDQDERKRRIDAAIEDAQIQVNAELGARRQAYAEFIEDKYMADTEALKKSTADAIRASNELLEANLKQAKGDEWAIAALKEENEERLQGIKEANARKQAALTLQSFTDTANAANAVTSGLSSALKSGSIGGSAGGAGGIFSGLATGLGDQYKSLGVFGQGISAIGGAVGALSDLFGKSDADRAREADQQKRRDDEAKALLELQANYQKSMLALQEAAAKLPFENLTRQLRLIDIESQKQTLAGGNAEAISKQRLAGRLSAMQGVLSSQAGSIGGGQLFGEVGATPDELINFLSNSAALRNQLGPLFGIGQSGGDYSAGKAALIEQSLQGLGYSGSYDDRIGAARQSLGLGLPSDSYDTSGVTSKDKLAFAAYLEAVNPTNNILEQLLSEFSTDTGIAENLLSVIEQTQQTQQEIAGHTKKTSENTAKLVETPTRSSSIIDISRGFTRSLGSVLSPTMSNTGLPEPVRAAVLATEIQKSLQERSLDRLEDLVRIQRDSRELLAIIGKALSGNTSATTDWRIQLEDLYRRAIG